MTHSERYEQLARFVRQISRFTREGECLTCFQPGIEDNSNCDDHAAWLMPVDDALQTMDSLISQARRLVKQLDS